MALALLQQDLEAHNESGARSLAEGLEETLTLHRLGAFSLLGELFKVTNYIESINAAVEACYAKVDHRVNFLQWHCWLAAAVWDIELRPRMAIGIYPSCGWLCNGN